MRNRDAKTSEKRGRTPGLSAGWACVALLLLAGTVSTQIEPDRGLHHSDPRWHALVGATLVPRPGETMENATVVMRDGVIVSVEADGEAPEGARVWDASGLTVYAGLVEPYIEVETPGPEAGEEGAHWNPLITPQRSVLDGDGPDDDLRASLRKLGFGAAGVAPADGILRGRASVFSLGDHDTEIADGAADVLEPDVYQVMSLDTARFSWGGPSRKAPYPTSEAGAMTLLRQTFLDADWYARVQAIHAEHPAGQEPPEVEDALEALIDEDAPPFLLDANNELQVLRALRLAGEFDRPLTILGSGTEYRRLDALVEAGPTIIMPLNFPEDPKVKSQAEAEQVSLRSLMAWEQAPTGPRRLVDAGLDVALTTHRMEKRKGFHEHLRKAIEQGLERDKALELITVAPARVLGMEGRLGEVAPGALANLVVVDGDLFDAEGKIRDVWVGGRRYEIEAAPFPDLDGEWDATFAQLGETDAAPGQVVIDGKKVTVKAMDAEAAAREVRLAVDRVAFLLDGGELGLEGVYALSAVVEDEAMHGTLMAPDGTLASWRAERGEAADDEAEDDEAEGSEEGDDDEEPTVPAVPDAFGTPMGAFAYAEPPSPLDVLVRGATIWTAGPDGIIEDGDLLVEDGRISYVGERNDALEADADVVLDATGKHITPGIIDAHSHTGISGGVNEVGERVTAEVRMSDVINPDDINWYRQLAGGLTAAHQLHGSANAIGGQNSVVKLRWGVAHPDEMRLEGARPGIKFALGENPKRVAANTGDPDEYPQTRMGVSTLIRDRLEAGRQDRAARERYEQLSGSERDRTYPPRRDLELEAMAEIVAGERLVHSHSYRQDEIFMLCQVADEYGFTIGTFQHVLEGYKVAEAIKQSALGASTFADWWAYKYEVIDAIPHNAALMTDVGVTVSINSDSSDHARRLNTEAGKAVKYGGLDPHEALKLVTLNPARQLMVDDRIGSLENGKDGDFAVWSGDPLSYLSRCESTWIDGREYFSLARHEELERHAAAERARIIQKLVVGEKKKAEDDEQAEEDGAHPDAATVDRPERWRAGWMDPPEHEQGDCGCDALFLESDR